MSYIKGKDLLLKVGGKAIGHCTSHTITYNTDSTEHKVKPEAEKPKSQALFSSKTPSGLNISISFEGLRYVGEKENGFDELAALWGAAEPIDVEGFKRGEGETSYLKGKFILDSLEESNPADDDASYSGQMSNAETPDVYPGMPAETTE